MPRSPLIVIGGSAGGVQALQVLLPNFPAELPAAVAIVLHRLASEDSERLPHLLSRHMHLDIGNARNGETVRAGKVFLALPDLHLEIVEDTFRLTAGPREHNSRPSIDVLFRTAAAGHGRKVVGIVLSGALDDGTAGLAAIKSAGGYAIVQEPSEAMYPSMPRHAIANVGVDVVCPVGEIARHVVHVLDTMMTPLGTRPEDDDGP